MSGSLDGVLVVDFSQLVQGPFATQILGDLGADVVKVEPLGGDWLRAFSLGDTYTHGESLSFLAFNRNKRSLAANLKDEAGRDAVLRLIDRADVLVENFRPGVMDRLGLGYETLAARNPGLVYCASSGYGPDGPYLTRPGQDLLAQSLAGLPWLQGNAGDAPTPVGIGIADLAAGLHIAYAVLAALIHRDRTGQGQRVDVNLLNSIVAMQAQELTWYLHTREVPQRSSAGIGSPFVGAPLGIYRTADGWIALAMNDVSTVAGLVGATVDLPEPGKNVMAGRDTIKAALDQAIADWQTTPLLEHLLAADIWCAPVQDYPAVVADPQLAHNEMIRTIRHPSVGDYQTIGPPVRFSHTPSTIERPPPLLGQHTDDLLREVCGLTPDQIADLHHRGAVRAAEEPSP